MSNQFFARILNHVMNEIVVKGLSESRMFQRFALRTHNNVQEMKKSGQEMMNKGMEHVEKEVAKQQVQQQQGATTKVTNKGQPPQPPLQGIPGFFSAFTKEIKKDLGMKI